MSLFPELTIRETEILTLVAQGYHDKEIALHLSISVHTVHCHVRKLFQRLDVSNRTAAAQVYWQRKSPKNNEN